MFHVSTVDCVKRLGVSVSVSHMDCVRRLGVSVSVSPSYQQCSVGVRRLGVSISACYTNKVRVSVRVSHWSMNEKWIVGGGGGQECACCNAWLQGGEG